MGGNNNTRNNIRVGYWCIGGGRNGLIWRTQNGVLILDTRDTASAGSALREGDRLGLGVRNCVRSAESSELDRCPQ